jgi:hypothetical protein
MGHAHSQLLRRPRLGHIVALWLFAAALELTAPVRAQGADAPASPAPAAVAQGTNTPELPAPGTLAQGSGTGSPTPAVTERPPAVWVVRMPSALGEKGLAQLTAQLQAAGAASTVVLYATDSAQLADNIDAALTKLRIAAEHSRLVVVGNASDIFTRFRQAGVSFKLISAPADLWANLEPPVAVTDNGTLLATSLPGSGSGPSALIFVVSALALGALALAGGRVYQSRTRRPQVREPLASPAPRRRPEPPPSPQPRARVQRRPTVASDARLPTSGRALVRTELVPDGYVELAGCLRRVHWAEPRATPTAPGGWVEVRVHQGRLIAFPSGRTGKER